MKREDLIEFTVKSRVCGPERMVQYVMGDVLVPGKALIIHGVDAADAWQIIGMLAQGLFNEGDLEYDAEKADKKVEAEIAKGRAGKAAKVEEPKKKEKNKSKAQQRAEEKKATTTKEEKVKEKADAEVEKKTNKTKKSNGKGKVAGIDLEQFKSASGLRELVGDFKEAGVETKEQVISYCIELQAAGVRCLKGVNIERRVSNLWDMVA